MVINSNLDTKALWQTYAWQCSSEQWAAGVPLWGRESSCCRQCRADDELLLRCLKWSAVITVCLIAAHTFFVYACTFVRVSFITPLGDRKFEGDPNTKTTCQQLLCLILLFPVWSVKQTQITSTSGYLTELRKQLQLLILHWILLKKTKWKLKTLVFLNLKEMSH